MTALPHSTAVPPFGRDINVLLFSPFSFYFLFHFCNLTEILPDSLSFLVHKYFIFLICHRLTRKIYSFPAKFFQKLSVVRNHNGCFGNFHWFLLLFFYFL